MKLKNTKTCEGCRAIAGIHGQGLHCELKFKTKSFIEPLFGLERISPAEPCFKPKTIDELLEAYKIRLERRNP